MKWENEENFIDAANNRFFVYSFLSENDEVLYIGQGLIYRPYHKDGNSGRDQAFEAKVKIVIREFQSAAEALDAETTFIHKYHPLGNRKCLLCSYYKISQRWGSRGALTQEAAEFVFGGRPKKLLIKKAKRL
jgi:hypothetical protein